MVGTSTGGEFNLQIKNVTIADDDLYECQISASETDSSVLSKPAKLTVLGIIFFEIIQFLAEPNKPVLLTKSLILNATEDVFINLSCQSSNGRPAARINWVISADPKGQDIINTIVNNLTQHPHHQTRGIKKLKLVKRNLSTFKS